MSDKTESPTPRRLNKARTEGNIPFSSALLQASGMLIVVALAPSALSATAQQTTKLFMECLQHASDPLAVSSSAILWMPVVLTAPMLATVATVVALVGYLQTNGVIAFGKLAPDLTRLSPSSLWRSLLSPQRLFGIVRAMATALVVIVLVIHRFESHMVDFVRTAGRLHEAAVVAGTLTRGIVRDVLLVMLVLAAVDWVVAYRAWWSRLKMTHAEVKREVRETEGDPQIKAARERAHQEVLYSATIQRVQEATVVIVNPTRLAHALRYEEKEDDAPVLIAKGEGALAKRMVEAAQAWGIAVVQNIPVARALSELTEGEAIPPGMYEAVAEILRDIAEHHVSQP